MAGECWRRRNPSGDRQEAIGEGGTPPVVGQEAREQMELGTAVAQHTLDQGFATAQETAAAQQAQGQGFDIVPEIVAAAALGLGKVAVQTSQVGEWR